MVEAKVLKKSGRKRAKYLDSSVKKLFIIGLVQGIPETYGNVEKILNELKLEKVPFSFCLSTDMKLQNIVVGIQSGSSAFPCAYCESRRPFDVVGMLRTLGRIRELCKQFDENGRKQKDAQEYFNAINMPLISGDDDTFIMDIIPIPELHLLLGIGEHEKIEMQFVEITCIC